MKQAVVKQFCFLYSDAFAGHVVIDSQEELLILTLD